MATESGEELTVSVELPAELVDWLDEEAATAELDRETLVAHLLASYQALSELDDAEELVEGGALAAPDGLEEAVTREVETALAEELDGAVAAAVTEELDRRLSDRPATAFENRVESLQAEFTEKLDDVRGRVIQVKKETDEKAPADHTHQEFDRLSSLETELDSLRAEFESFSTEYEQRVSEQGEQASDHAQQLETLQERLQTVAWVVSDLREAQRSTSGLEAVERIKRAAARADVERATCENCGESVVVSLLTDPHCPHCEVTVNNVEPASGWFGSATLTVASQLESGGDP